MHGDVADEGRVLPLIVEFIRSLGIGVDEVALEGESTFLHGTAIREGGLVNDPGGRF